MHIIDVARVCYEVNRAYRIALEETDRGAWGEIPEEKRVSIVRGVQNYVDDPEMTPERSHELWRLEPVNADHELNVPYEQLSHPAKVKDHLFLGTINALRPFIDDAEQPTPRRRSVRS